MRRLSSVVVVAVLLLFSAQAVSADALLADGDGLAPVANGRLDLGTICHEAEATATVPVAVRATGHPNGRQVFENGVTVTTDASVITGVGLAASSGAPAVAMPAAWRSQPNGSMSGSVEWQVAVTPAVLGRYRGTVEFSASGVNRHGEMITRVRRMNVVARAIDCTAPLIADVPTDMAIEATGSDGADLVYVSPSAADAVDGPVAVDCDVPSGSRIPLGSNQVTCSAGDAAGNVATAAFTVIVADTVAPVLDTMPGDQHVTAADDVGAIVAWPMLTATDDVDGSRPVSCDPASGALFAPGATTVTCMAADVSGNVAAATFVVQVEAPAAPTEPEPAPTDPDGQLAPSTTPEHEAVVASGTAPQGADVEAGAPVLPDTRVRTDLEQTRPVTAVAGLAAMVLALVLAVARRRGRTA